MTRAVAALAPTVRDRSGGRCEAAWSLVESVNGIVGLRCDAPADEIHHRIGRGRARVGDEHLLDLAGDVDNLVDLCRPCHDLTHGQPVVAASAWAVGDYGATAMPELRRGLYVYGQIRTAPDGTLVYWGPHPAYERRYPPAVTPAT